MKNLELSPLTGPARVGIGGPVGSGKTALLERLIPAFQKRGIEVGVITNDLVTTEDADRLRKSGLIAPERVMAVEAGACPHTVIREDPTLNIEAAERMAIQFPELEMIMIESGGDNLASTFSLDLVDLWMFVIDVAGGDDIPRKRGPGVLQSDLLVINKTDLAPYVGVNLDAMLIEAKRVRQQRPVVSINCRAGEGIDYIVDYLIRNLLFKSSAASTQAANSDE
ncbi:Urease accessory protein UreG [Marinobacter psychrophilus]|jgi:urease accessory protein|uniref:Urease accessory protein UreG n=1 Tax=Marinobacter psychrophilus TaxID=330734 RepID=A0A0H4I0P4_9GAMM|nr:urease accessory protein UreG [Marinobacter psychrophilus]AKO52536.1 Urease accessory protein UreG [Marinobacter psychrophilus]